MWQEALVQFCNQSVLIKGQLTNLLKMCNFSGRHFAHADGGALIKFVKGQTEGCFRLPIPCFVYTNILVQTACFTQSQAKIVTRQITLIVLLQPLFSAKVQKSCSTARFDPDFSAVNV